MMLFRAIFLKSKVETTANDGQPAAAGVWARGHGAGLYQAREQPAGAPGRRGKLEGDSGRPREENV